MSHWHWPADWSRLSRSLSRPLLSGVLLALAFPDPALFPLAWIALVPYLLFLLDRPPASLLWPGHFLFSLAYLGILLYWIPHVLTAYGGFGFVLSGLLLLLMLGALSCFLLPFSLGVRWLASRSPLVALLGAPPLWLIGELVRTYFPAGGFPWGALGYSQYPLKWLLQSVDIGGVYLLSLLILWANSAFAARLRSRSRAGRMGAGVATVFVLLNLYGIYRLETLPQEESEMRVDLVQPVVELSRDRDYYGQMFFRKIPDLYRRAAVDGADWVILPEAPNPFLFDRDFYFRTFWQKLAIDYKVPVLLGATAREDGNSRRYNSFYLIDASGEESYRYDKTHLVPFGEYLPWGRIFGFVRPLVQQVGGFSAGASDQPLGKVLGEPFGILICYESIFPQLSLRMARLGARLLVNVTNDHWFGETSAPSQHLQMAAFRAVETRRPMLRAANSGYTALIDFTGGIQERSQLNQETIQSVRLHPSSTQSPFLIWGQGLVLSLIMMNGILVFFVARKTELEKGN